MGNISSLNVLCFCLEEDLAFSSFSEFEQVSRASLYVEYSIAPATSKGGSISFSEEMRRSYWLCSKGQ